MQLDIAHPRQVDEYLALEWVASEPYTRFVYGEADPARAAHRYLFFEEKCEFAPPFARVVVADGRVTAVAAWLSGADLRERRLRGAVALAKGGFFRNDPSLRSRMRSAATTLLEPETADLYLSRLAVHQEARGRGLGRRLLAQCEEEGRRRSCRRVVLEVSPVHQAAAALYAGAGFEELDSRWVSDPDTGRELSYRHLAKLL